MILMTCGDAQVLTGSKKHVDPVLCVCVGAHVLCIIDNNNLTSKVPRVNGALCYVAESKVKDMLKAVDGKPYYITRK